MGVDRPGSATDLHRGHRGPAWAAFEQFEEKWGKAYPAIPKLWRAAWNEFIPFLDYDLEIRKVLCSTNAIDVAGRPLPPRGHRQGPLPDRAGCAEDAVPGHQVAGPQGPGTGTMGHPVEAGPERVCDHLRRPDADRGEPLKKPPVTPFF